MNNVMTVSAVISVSKRFERKNKEETLYYFYTLEETGIGTL